MHRKMKNLKAEVQAMEESMVALDLDDFQNRMRSVRRLLSSVEQEFVKAVSSTKTVMHSHEDQSGMSPKPYRIINTLAFMYKPTKRIDIFEGGYLEFFGEERTAQLMQAMAINQHNEFWKQHNTIHGNVYGSVPKELIKPENAKQLEQFGWQEVNVNILDFGQTVENERELVQYCSSCFSHYILILEESTGSYLVLEYLT